jgi:hypothetical protein
MPISEDVLRVLYILEHNPIPIEYIAMYSGKIPFRKGGGGYTQQDWADAWKLCENITVVQGYGRLGKLLYNGPREGFIFSV